MMKNLLKVKGLGAVLEAQSAESLFCRPVRK